MGDLLQGSDVVFDRSADRCRVLGEEAGGVGGGESLGAGQSSGGACTVIVQIDVQQTVAVSRSARRR
jgi:hypothetical protein